MPNRVPIFLSGVTVGYISLSWSEELPIGEGLPPSVGLGGMPASPGAARAFGGGASHPRRLGGDHGASHGVSHAPPRRRLGGPHTGEHHERHLDPHNRTRMAESSKPEHMTTLDVARATEGKAEPTFPNIQRGGHLVV
jgi:hypothetical protein